MVIFGKLRNMHVCRCLILGEEVATLLLLLLLRVAVMTWMISAIADNDTAIMMSVYNILYIFDMVLIHVIVWLQLTRC